MRTYNNITSIATPVLRCDPTSAPVSALCLWCRARRKTDSNVLKTSKPLLWRLQRIRVLAQDPLPGWSSVDTVTLRVLPCPGTGSRHALMGSKRTGTHLQHPACAANYHGPTLRVNRNMTRTWLGREPTSTATGSGRVADGEAHMLT